MNVSELARQLHIHPKEMMEILPQYGFDIGVKAVKVDDRVAEKIVKQWRFIKRDLEDKKRLEAEERKRLEREERKQSGQTVTLPAVITVRALAERLSLSVTQIITELMKNGILANQNQNIDYDTAAVIADELGFTAQKEAGDTNKPNQEIARSETLEAALAKGTDRQSRPPVVVVMGHVDHGKTTLLDAIRQTHVTATESGGITQHIGAYQTMWKDPKTSASRALTFIDTPGHEAFTIMRSRGAKVADIAILVVAADDGVKPQTEEVIQIIRAAKLPFVVAINKIDKPGADLQRVKTELSQKGVIPEEWGGDVPMVEIAAKAKLNIDKLLDVLLLVADLHPEAIQADPSIPAVGTVIEANMNKQTGPIATVLVQAGTLHRGDALVVNHEIYGKVRAMKDYRGQDITEATPSVPVQIIGFKVAPEVGDVLDVSMEMGSEKIDIKQKRSRQTSAQPLIKFSRASDDEEKKKTLNLVIKADVLGSLEAIIGLIEKIRHDEVEVKIIGKGMGNINEDDVHKAEAGHGVVVGFHVLATPLAQEQLRDKNILFMKYDVIYDLVDWVKNELEKLLEKEKIITEVGRIKVLAIFRTEKNAMTIGGRVEDGRAKAVKARVKRDGEFVGEGKIVGLQSGKQEVKEVPSGSECGVRFEGKTKIVVGDVLELFSEESKARKIVFQF